METPSGGSAGRRAGPEELDEVTGALEALVDLLDREDDLRVIMQQVCQQGITAIPETDMAGVTVFRQGQPETVAWTDDLVLDVDNAQYGSGEGPCLEAFATGAVVKVDAEDAARRWPEFARRARNVGTASYLAAPMVVDEGLAGALNLYSYASHGFRAIEATLLELFTTAVQGTLRGTRRYHAARRLAEQLREALVSRAVIDQAKGIIMAARGLTADEAFAELKRESQRENVKLRDLAARFVNTVTASAGRAERP